MKLRSLYGAAHRGSLHRTLYAAGALATFVLSPPPVFQARMQSASRPEFEAASLKPSPPDARGAGISVLPGGKLRARNINLKWMITVAFTVSNYQVFGDLDLLSSPNYDIDAEASGPAETPEIRRMLQSLLEDRFKLKFHRETRQLPIYTLKLAKEGSKGGPGLVEDFSGDCAAAVTNQNEPSDRTKGPLVACGNVNLAPGRINGRRGRMVQLADRLSGVLGRTVVDNTGLAGLYNITLTWTRDPTSGEPAPASDPAGPSVFTAIQEQLGLKLQADKGPVEVIVIDSAEKPAQSRLRNHDHEYARRRL